MINFPYVIQALLSNGTPYIFATIAIIWAERVGVLNIGLEGIMLMSASTSFVATLFSQNLIVGIVVGTLTGLIFGLMYSVFSITLRIDQIVLGTGIWLAGMGFSDFLAQSYGGHRAAYVTPFQPITIPFVTNTPVGVIFSQNWMVYFSIFLALFSYYILHRTSFGLKVKAIGESPSSADTVGIRVYSIRYICVIISCVIGSFGGSYITIGHSGTWYFNITSGTGFIAIAIARLGGWNSLRATVIALLFSTVTGIQYLLQASIVGIPAEVFQVLPYVIALSNLGD